MNVWQRWKRQPQTLLFRKALFQVHLFTGLALGLYVVVICLSGSVLVYRNELYRTFSPKPTIVSGSGLALSSDAIADVAARAYPRHELSEVQPGKTPNHAVEVTLTRRNQTTRRLFHPFTGEDLGHPIPAGFRITAWLLDLHDNLLAGETGRRVNGGGALLLVVLCGTGAVIWWPGVAGWRRSLTFEPGSNWKRLTWSVHSALGFWFFAFILMWGITGTYLSFQPEVAAAFDYLQPFDPDRPGERLVDRVQYWLAYLHFGRLGGRGIPGCGRGICDEVSKATWAGVGLVPPLMFITGALMWWNARRRVRSESASSGRDDVRVGPW